MTAFTVAPNPAQNAAQPLFRTNPQPLILPGLFTAINSENARPVDRVFASYGYFDSFRVASPAGGVVPGFNLNRFDIGAEKTFLDGRASLYVRVPFLYATSNTTGQPIDGLGDVSAGLKYALLQNQETGSTLTGGMTVSAPTARDTVVSTTTFQNNTPFTGANDLATFNRLFPTQTTRINPTFLQPWVGGLLVLDRFFVQEYFAVIIPTDDRVSTFINNDVGIGYQLFRTDCPDSLLTSVTPTVGVQTLIPLNHQGSQGTTTATPAALASTTGVGNGVPAATLAGLAQQNTPALSVNSPYQVFVTGGVGIGIGERALLSLGVVTPVTGPKAYSTGGTVGLNLFF